MIALEGADARHDRLRRWLDAAAAAWLVVLPALRPLVWSGEPSDTANAGYACLLAAAIATGLMRRALGGGSLALGRVAWVGVVFLAIAAIGAWRSPFPFQAWTTWCGWVLHLGAAVALSDVIHARPGLLVAGLLAGLAAECATLAAQVRWERPALIAQLAINPAAVEQEQLREQYEVRATTWRLEGTFLLANTLAAYLITVVPLVAGLAWSAWRRRAPGRFALSALTALALLALARSGSKMGMLALLLASMVVAGSCAGRWRTVILAALLGVLLTGLALPTLRERVVASAGVRIDYWRAGVGMIAERPWSGHGLDGFQLHYPRLKPPAAEETIIAHNEPLQAAVDLGLPAAALLVAWWVLALTGVWRTRRVIALDEPARARGAAALTAGAVMVYAFVVTGVLDGRALEPIWQLGYGAGLIVLAVVVAWGVPLPPLPAWAAPIGLLACLIHAGADFHLHSPQVVGPLALIAVLATGRSSVAPRVFSRVFARVGAATAIALLAVISGLGIVWAARDDLRQRAMLADTVLHRLVLEHQFAYPGSEETVAGLHEALGEFGIGLAMLEPQPELRLADAAVAELAAASARWPADPALATLAVSIAVRASQLDPASEMRFTRFFSDALQRWPGHLGFVAPAAEHHRRLADLPDVDRDSSLAMAQALYVRAVKLYPTHLPLRRRLARVARMRGDMATAQAQEAEVARLLPSVHPTNR